MEYEIRRFLEQEAIRVYRVMVDEFKDALSDNPTYDVVSYVRTSPAIARRVMIMATHIPPCQGDKKFLTTVDHRSTDNDMVVELYITCHFGGHTLFRPIPRKRRRHRAVRRRR